VIGYKGDIPWNISDDLKWFKRLTMGIPYQRALLNKPFNVEPTDNGGILVMGMKTYQKVGLLKGRYHYVLTRNPEKLALPKTDVMKYATFNDVILLSQVSYLWGNTWVIGGAEIYTLFMPQVLEVFVTYIADEYEGDAFMPEFETQFTEQELLREEKDYSIVRYFGKRLI
jgi:dihydrofolate reductase